MGVHHWRGSGVYLDSNLFRFAGPPQQGALHTCTDYPSLSAFLFLYGQVVLVLFSIPFFHVQRACNELCLGERLVLELGTLGRGRLLERERLVRAGWWWKTRTDLALLILHPAYCRRGVRDGVRARTVSSAKRYTRRLNLVHIVWSEGGDFPSLCINGDAERDATTDLLLCLLFLGWRYEFWVEGSRLPRVRECSDAFQVCSVGL